VTEPLPQLSQSFVIAAPPERVWTVMSDVVRWPEWTRSVSSVWRLEPGPLQVGSRVVIKQPRFPAARWLVTDVEPGHAFTWVSLGPAMRVTATHVVEPDGSGSRVTLALTYEGMIGRLMGRLTRGISERYVAMEGEGLRRRCEASA
jgi:uncharacterized membrane protein